MHLTISRTQQECLHNSQKLPVWGYGAHPRDKTSINASNRLQSNANRVCRTRAHCRSIMKHALFSALLVLSFLVQAQKSQLSYPPFRLTFWQSQVAEQSDRIFEILFDAQDDLARWHLRLPESVSISIYPDLASYQQATGVPYTIMALSNRETASIHTQRIGILLQRGSLEKTLRHELFHLAQPEDLRRWQAEALAMRFAGEVWLGSSSYQHLSEAELDAMLAQSKHIPALMREVYRRGQQLSPREVLDDVGGSSP